MVDHDGVSIAYSVSGSGPDLVLLHPLLLDRRCFDDLVSRLSDRFRVIAVDLRGFGESRTGAGASDAGTMAADVIAVLDAAGAARAALCGVSLGAYVAMAAGASYPERATSLAIVSAGTGAVSDADRQQLLRMADALPRLGSEAVAAWALTRLMPPDASPELRRQLARYVGVNDRVGVANALRGAAARGDLAAELGATRIPVLVLAGDRDPLVSREAARAAAEAIRGARFRVLPGMGHFPQLERPDVLADALVSFIADSSKG